MASDSNVISESDDLREPLPKRRAGEYREEAIILERSPKKGAGGPEAIIVEHLDTSKKAESDKYDLRELLPERRAGEGREEAIIIQPSPKKGAGDGRKEAIIVEHLEPLPKKAGQEKWYV